LQKRKPVAKRKRDLGSLEFAGFLDRAPGSVAQMQPVRKLYRARDQKLMCGSAEYFGGK
jgi:hypothetical protein